MAKKDKAQVETEETQDDAAESDAGAVGQKKGFIKKILGNRKLLIVTGAGLAVLVIGGGAGGYLLLSNRHAAGGMQMADAAPPEPIVAPQVAFFDMPDLIVNIQTGDGTAAYLKLGVALELTSASDRAGMQALKPRIVDQFQGYLRELRVDDLKGSAGVLRLKEELLRRVNMAASPYRVKDVLLKEMIVQ